MRRRDSRYLSGWGVDRIPLREELRWPYKAMGAALDDGRGEFLRHPRGEREDEMSLRPLRLDRIGRWSAPLVAAALLLRSAIFVSAQSERLPKVGYLGFGGSVPPTHFQNRMRELRYSEGKEVTVEYRFAEGRPGELPRLARELVDPKVDVILAVGDEPIVAAKNATRTVPIVMVACDARSPPASSKASLVQARQSHERGLYYLRAMPKHDGGVPRASAICVPPRGPSQPRKRQ